MDAEQKEGAEILKRYGLSRQLSMREMPKFKKKRELAVESAENRASSSL